MTREELKAHCLKEIENCEIWARYHGEEPYRKIYEEHELILELLEQESVLDQISEIIEPLRHLPIGEMSDIEWDILRVIDKYKAESEE